MLPKDWRQQLQSAYPKRMGQGWLNAKRQIQIHLEAGELFDEMVQGANNYRVHCAESGEFVRMAQTFFGPNMWWLEFLDDESCENVITLDDEAKSQGLIRSDGESDNSLKDRIGTAQTKAMYPV